MTGSELILEQALFSLKCFIWSKKQSEEYKGMSEAQAAFDDVLGEVNYLLQEVEARDVVEED